MSTGPRTPSGKAMSSLNHMSHGLRSEGPAAPGREDGEVARRMREWAEVLRPSGGLDDFMLEVAAVESLRLRRCREHERALMQEHRIRVEESWDADRRLAAEVLAKGLADDPAVIALRLQQTAQGCDWLIGGWEYLGRVLDGPGDWTEAQRARALDLLGVPAERREGPSPLDPAPGGDAREHRRAVVAAELGRLRELREGVLAGRDERERRAAALGLSAELPPGVALVRRYATTSARRLEKALAHFRTSRPAGRRPAGPLPAPERRPPAPPPPSAASSADAALASLEALLGPLPEELVPPVSDPAPRPDRHPRPAPRPFARRT